MSGPAELSYHTHHIIWKHFLDDAIIAAVQPPLVGADYYEHSMQALLRR
jgi:hypothetical protein